VEPLLYGEDRVEVGALPPAVLMQLVEDAIPVQHCQAQLYDQCRSTGKGSSEK
jgi:hypothetical protein